jgi:hypothetical protein
MSSSSRSAPPRLAATAIAVLVALLFGGCGGGIRGHAEIGGVGQTMEIGTIAAASSEQTLHVELDVLDGAVRVAVIRADANVVWEAIGTPSSPVRADVDLTAGAGPWRATLTAIEAPGVADYRIETRR